MIPAEQQLRGVRAQVHDLTVAALAGVKALNHYAVRCHEANLRWWRPLRCQGCCNDTDAQGICHAPGCRFYGAEQKLARNKGELLMLIVTEVAEAMEGARKDLPDDKLPHRKMEEVELADALIRIFDYAGAHGFDLDGAFEEKMAYNASREDHTLAARRAEGGKKF